MSTKEELIERWKTADGSRRRSAIIRAIYDARDQSIKVDWGPILIGFLHSAEVSPGDDLRGIDFSNLDLRGCDLVATYLDHANLDGCVLREANLHYAHMSMTSLLGADCANAGMTQANAVGATFDNALLNGADFVGAQLADASFRKAILRGAHFDHADLTGATLEGAVTDGADFTGVVVDRAFLPEATWYHVANALRSWASHGKRLRVEVTGLPAEHRAAAQRAFLKAGMEDVSVTEEGDRMFVCGLSTVR